jgi:uncharacterized protein (DUF433 family)
LRRQIGEKDEPYPMARTNWLDPDLHHGDPCIKGTRIPVFIILGSLADALTPDEIRTAYPQLVLQDIQAALAFDRGGTSRNPGPVAGLSRSNADQTRNLKIS